MDFESHIESIEEERQKHALKMGRVSQLLTCMVVITNIIDVLSQRFGFFNNMPYTLYVSLSIVFIDFLFEWTVRRSMYLREGRSPYLGIIAAMIRKIKQVNLNHEPVTEMGRMEHARILGIMNEHLRKLTFEDSMIEVIAI